LLFTGLTTTFLKEFLFDLWLTSPLLLSLAAVITVLGQVAGKKEGWSPLCKLPTPYRALRGPGDGEWTGLGRDRPGEFGV
jgi:hypothetical protein